MDLKLKGKNAVVTGASRGVGRAIALGLAKEAESYGVKATALAADLGSSESTLAFMQEAERLLGDLDILVNNAGIWLQGWCQEIPLEDWQRSLDVNLTGPFLTSQYFAKSNLGKGRPGRIININSQAAFNEIGRAHV